MGCKPNIYLDTRYNHRLIDFLIALDKFVAADIVHIDSIDGIGEFGEIIEIIHIA